jgi:hypothetical protein
MSKISYCSLDEAWGNNSMSDTKYNKLQEKSDSEMKSVIQNMNSIERNSDTENNLENNKITEYNKFRFNNDDSNEKKKLMEKLQYLEKELFKYKNLFEKCESSRNTIEKFDNKIQDNNQPTNKVNDIFDLILLIIIGLIIILVMNSIFNIGKTISSRK